MHDDLRLEGLEDAVDVAGVRNRRLFDLQALVICRKGIVSRRGEVVDHEHGVPAFEQLLGDVRCNEAGAAGDEHVGHRFASLSFESGS